jgi:hypothetical protein
MIREIIEILIIAKDKMPQSHDTTPAALLESAKNNVLKENEIANKNTQKAILLE